MSARLIAIGYTPAVGRAAEIEAGEVKCERITTSKMYLNRRKIAES